MRPTPDRLSAIAAPPPVPVATPEDETAPRPDPVPGRRDRPPSTTTLRDRATDRHRAAARVSAAYTTAYGHPTAHAGFARADEGDGRRRWATTPALATAAAVLVLVAAVGVGWFALRDGASAVPASGATSPTVIVPEASPDETGPSDPAPGGGVVVHVVGQVASPGLITLASGARVADAVEAAGGALDGADLSGVNLARIVVDGEQIVIPLPGEAIAPPPGAVVPGGAGGGLVDLNSADAATLDGLPGIGPVLAERIVAWRTENGPFSSVDQLGEVSGIGPAVLDKVRDLVRV